MARGVVARVFLIGLRPISSLTSSPSRITRGIFKQQEIIICDPTSKFTLLFSSEDFLYWHFNLSQIPQGVLTPTNKHCDNLLSSTLLDCPFRKLSAYSYIYLYITHLPRFNFCACLGWIYHLIKCVTKSDVGDGYYQPELHPRASDWQQRSLRAGLRDTPCFIASKATRT